MCVLSVSGLLLAPFSVVQLVNLFVTSARNPVAVVDLILV